MPIYTADCIIGTKKLRLIYSSSNFRHDNTWDEKRWWSSYSSVPIIARAYHLKYKCHYAPEFGLGLQCSAMWPRICETLYCPLINVETFRFCWWIFGFITTTRYFALWISWVSKLSLSLELTNLDLLSFDLQILCNRNQGGTGNSARDPRSRGGGRGGWVSEPLNVKKKNSLNLFLVVRSNESKSLWASWQIMRMAQRTLKKKMIIIIIIYYCTCIFADCEELIPVGYEGVTYEKNEKEKKNPIWWMWNIMGIFINNIVTK